MKPKLGSGTDESSLYFKDGEAGREEVKKHHQASSGLVGFIKNRKRAFSYGSAEHREMCMVVPRDKQHQVLSRASSAEKRDTTQLKVRSEEGRLEHGLDGHRSFHFFSTRWITLENPEIMEGGSKRTEKNGILSLPAKLTVMCPDMGTNSKGRTRHCCPKEQDKWSLTPHLPDLQLGRAVQKPSSPKPQGAVNW